MKQNLLPNPDSLLEIAFSRARKQAKAIGKIKSRTQWLKTREIKKIETASDTLEQKLGEAIKGFPSIDKLPAFQKELLETTIDTIKTKKAIAQFSAAQRIIKKIRRLQIRKIIILGKKNERKMKNATKEFFGRISEITKSLAQSIENYNETLKKMNELPDIDFTMPTIILAGSPNTGKSTILARLTTAKPKIASYPFTTQKLQLGYFEAHYLKIQVIDTPGLLDRRIEKRNNTEKKAIAAMRHLAKIIVFVLDPTTHCGYALQEQLNLLHDIEKNFPKTKKIVAINKTDIATKEQIEEAKKTISGEIVLEGNGIQSELREKIFKTLKKQSL